MRFFTLGIYSVLFSVFAVFNAGCAPYHHHLVGVGVEIKSDNRHDNGHHYGERKHHKHHDDDDDDDH